MTDDGGENRDTPWLLETEQAGRRQRRDPLSRQEIVMAALRIVDQDGLDSLTMRRLGDELGVRAMAMYRHVRDKNQLLDLLIEGVLRDVEWPEFVDDWRADSSAIARAMRRAMIRHRHAITLLASRPWVGGAGLAGVDQTIGVFRRAGLPDQAAVHAQFALGNYVTGFCAWEAANMGAASEDPRARAEALGQYRELVGGLPAARYPNLVAVADVLVAGSLDERFDAGLGFLLDGIAGLLEHNGRARREGDGSKAAAPDPGVR